MSTQFHSLWGNTYIATKTIHPNNIRQWHTFIMTMHTWKSPQTKQERTALVAVVRITSLLQSLGVWVFPELYCLLWGIPFHSHGLGVALLGIVRLFFLHTPPSLSRVRAYARACMRVCVGGREGRRQADTNAHTYYTVQYNINVVTWRYHYNVLSSMMFVCVKALQFSFVILVHFLMSPVSQSLT